MAHMYPGYRVIKRKFNDSRGPKFIFISRSQEGGRKSISLGAFNDFWL